MHIPAEPEVKEKEYYLKHYQGLLTFVSVFSFVGVFVSSVWFFSSNPLLYFFFPFLFFITLDYIVALLVQGIPYNFYIADHDKNIKKQIERKKQSIDVFLPICGEDISIIRNTWNGVSQMRAHYSGPVTVYCLDDGNDKQLKKLAKEFRFEYHVRENRGYLKKAGNLKHAFDNSSGDFIIIFDADFKPRKDFIDELLHYFNTDHRLGIIQTPQYFDAVKSQNWLERGAASVQEYFYRSIQQNRQKYNGAICVGSNAIYRRRALNSNGGITRIEHSEDMHTGFDIYTHGWKLLYVPIILAKGVCPNDIRSFFGQQYRWCMGSMSLLFASKFWISKLPIMTRLSYISGSLYYIHTALVVIATPLLAMALLFVAHQSVAIKGYLLLIPAVLFLYIIFPLWHKSSFKFEVISIRIIYGWAHVFSIFNSITGAGHMAWNPTGKKSANSSHFTFFKIAMFVWNLPLGLVWVAASVYRMATMDPIDFLPVFLGGIIYLGAVLRILYLLYREGK